MGAAQSRQLEIIERNNWLPFSNSSKVVTSPSLDFFSHPSGWLHSRLLDCKSSFQSSPSSGFRLEVQIVSRDSAIIDYFCLSLNTRGIDFSITEWKTRMIQISRLLSFRPVRVETWHVQQTDCHPMEANWLRMTEQLHWTRTKHVLWTASRH